jgi:hypothetical protein
MEKLSALLSKILRPCCSVNGVLTNATWCSCSDGWFRGFRDRKLIALRAPTSQATNMPEDYREVALRFIRFIRRNTWPRPGESWCEVGRFYRRLIFNVDQMALPFDFVTGKTYAPKGARSVKKKSEGPKTWARRMATLMIMVTADGQLHCKPLLILRGQGRSKALRHEAKFYDKHVVIQWNAKAYCNQESMIEWIDEQYRNCISPEDRKAKAPRLLTLDTCPSHLTQNVLEALGDARLNTTVAFIPEGMTPYLQPVDTHINKPLKSRIAQFLEERIEVGWRSGFPGKKPVAIRERRILMTKCVADAWEELHREKPHLIRKSFQETGIALDPLGPEDDKLRVRDLDGLAGDIGDYDDYVEGGLNCNLEPGPAGKKRRTGDGLVEEDNWPRILQLLKDKGVPADAHEVEEREEEDELYELGNVVED